MEQSSEYMDIEVSQVETSNKNIQVSNTHHRTDYTLDNLKLLNERHNSAKTEEEKEDSLNKIFNFLSSVDIFNTSMTSSAQEDYFTSIFSPKLLNSIINNPSASNAYIREVQVSLINFYIEKFVHFMHVVKYIPIWSALISIFDDSKAFYKARNKNFDIGERFLESYYEILNPNAEEWRGNLTKGDTLDILVLEKESSGFSNEKRLFGAWSRGQIVELESNRMAKIKLLGKGDFVSVSLNSALLAPLGMFSKDFDWRESLVYPNKVDILDNKSWYIGTVMDTFTKTKGMMDKNEYKHAKIGIRIYKKEAKNHDSKNRSYFGFSEAFDKEMSVHDPRIRPPWTFAKQIHNFEALNKYPNDSKKFSEVETYFPHEVHGKKFFAVGHRSDREVDLTYIEMINRFGDLNGFEQCLNIINKGNDEIYESNKEFHNGNKTTHEKETCVNSTSNDNNIKINLDELNDNVNNNCNDISLINETQLNTGIQKLLGESSTHADLSNPTENFPQIQNNLSENKINIYKDFDTMDLYINIITDLLNYIHTYLHSEFTKSYLPKFLDRVFLILNEFSLNDECRYKSFPKKEKFENLFKKLKELMNRIYIETDANHQWESFLLTFSIACLNSSSLEKKLLGLKTLTDVLTEVNRTGYLLPMSSACQYETHLSLAKVSSILHQENIIDILFGKNSHLQIVQNSSLILRALVNSKIFGEAEIERLYVVYKSTSDINLNMAMFKVLKDNLYSFGTHLQKFFLRYMIDNIKQEGVNAFLKPELELILSLHQKLPLTESTHFNKEIGSYFLHLLYLDSQEFFETILNETLSLIKSYDFKESRVGFIETILNKIKSVKTPDKVEGSTFNQPNVHIAVKSMKIIRRIMSSTSANFEEYQRNKIYNLMFDEFDILNLLIETLQIECGDDKDELVTEFFSFMHFLLTNSTRRFKLNDSQIDNLFFTFINDIKSINGFFKLLKEADDRKHLPENTFARIFSFMVDNKNSVRLNDLNLELIKVLWTIFLNVNRANGSIEIKQKQLPASNTNTNNNGNSSSFVSNHNTGFSSALLNNNSSNNNSYSFNPNDIEIHINGSPFDLIGFSLIYKAVVDVSDKSTADLCIRNFLVLFELEDKSLKQRQEVWGKTIQMAFEDIEECVNKNNQGETNRIENILHFLKLLIEVSESNNESILILPHSSISNYTSNVLTFSCQLNNKDDYFQVLIYADRTVSELKKTILSKLKTYFNQQNLQIGNPNLIIKYENKELSEDTNKQLLFNYFNFNQEEAKFPIPILVEINDNPNQALQQLQKNPKIKLLDKNGELIPQLREILTNIFSVYATSQENGVYFSNEDLAKFIKSATNLNEEFDISPDDPRVVNLMSKYGNQDNLLSFDNFLKFYKDQISNKVEAVWENLANFGYKNNLSHISENEDVKTLRALMPRWLIAQSNYFEMVFNLQGKVENAFDFLETIATNPIRFASALNVNLYKSLSSYTNSFDCVYAIRIIDWYFNKCLIKTKVDCEEIDDLIFENEKSDFLNTNNNLCAWLNTFITNRLEEIVKIFINLNYEPTNFKGNLIYCNTLLSIFHILKNAFYYCLNSNSNIETNSSAYMSNLLFSYKNDILNKLLNVLDVIISESNQELISSSFDLLTTIWICDKNEELTNLILNDLKFQSIITKGLVMNSSSQIRNNFCNSLTHLIVLLSKFNPNILIKITDLIQDKIFQLQTNTEKKQCEQLFILEQRLISLCYSQGINSGSLKINFASLTLSICEILEIEVETITDEVIIGFLQLLSCLAANDQNVKSILCDRNIIKLLIDKYTFKDKINNQINNDLNTNNPTINRSTNCATSIYELITILCNDNLACLLQLFHTKISEIPFNMSKKKQNNLNLSPRAECNFVGLKNLGCICYMNSMLQQFFTIPSLRYMLLQADDKKGKSYSLEDDKVDDNLLHQLQRMFTFLSLSDRMSFNPKDFCYAYKDFSGKRTNLTQQQDAQEFLGRLFDLLDNSLKSTYSAHALHSVFGGTTLSKLSCSICGTVRNNFEEFCNLSLEVKNMKTLKDSLDKYTAEENIEGYFCETCQKATTLTKKNQLANLPNVLIVHLQRIGYNYDTGANEKVNSKLDFPKKLNLKGYTAVDSSDDRIYEREDKYYEYNLVGVVVHIGHADAGHYISYINTDREGEDGCTVINRQCSEGNWLNFNDAYVTKFDVNTLEENTFGGDSGIYENGNSSSFPLPAPPGINHENINTFDASTRTAVGFGSGNYNQPETGQSAYMLFYERVKKAPLKVIIDKENIGKIDSKINEKDVTSSNGEMDNHMDIETNTINNSLDLNNSINVVNLNQDNKYSILKNVDIFNKETSELPYNKYFFDEGKNEWFEYLPFYSVSKKVPDEYFYEVCNDNIEFLNDQKIFSQNFNDFIGRIIYILESILTTHKNILTNNNQDKDINFMLSVICGYIFEVVSKNNKSKYTLERLVSLMTQFPFVSGILADYLVNNSEVLVEVIFSSDDSASFYKTLICTAIKTNIKTEQSQINSNNINNNINTDNNNYKLLTTLIGFLPVTASKNWTKMLNFLEIFEDLSKEEALIPFLIESCLISKLIDFFLGKDSPSFSNAENRVDISKSTANAKFAPLLSTIANLISHKDKIAIPEIDLLFLKEKKFYTNALKENYNNSALSRVMAYMMTDDYEFSVTAVYWAIEVLNRNTNLQEAKNGLDIISEIVLIDDKFTRVRLEWIFGLPQIVINLNTFSVPSMPFNVNRHGDKLFKFVSHLLLYCSSNLDCLVERMFYKFYSSSDYLHIINLFIENILLKADLAMRYFDNLPHPKPGNNHSSNARAKDFLFELAKEEIMRLSNYSNTKPYEHAIQTFYSLVEKYENKTNQINLNEIEVKNKEIDKEITITVTEHLNTNEVEKNPITNELMNDIANTEVQEDVNTEMKNVINLNSVPDSNLNNRVPHFDSEMDRCMYDHNYKKGHIYSDIIYSCDHLDEESTLSMTSKKVYLICIEMEAEAKDGSAITSISLPNVINTCYSPPKDDCQFLPSSAYQGKSEDELYRNLCNGQLKPEVKFRRVLKSYIPTGVTVSNVFRRYILYNPTGVDYRLKLKFLPKEGSKMNCYLPKTEVVIVIKKFNGQNVITICKADHSKPYGDYTISIDAQELHADSIMLKAGNQGHLINVFQEEEIKPKENKVSEVISDENLAAIEENSNRMLSLQ